MYRDSKHKCKLEIVRALCAMRELASIENYSYKKKQLYQNVSIKSVKKFRFLTKNYDFD